MRDDFRGEGKVLVTKEKLTIERILGDTLLAIFLTLWLQRFFATLHWVQS